MATRLEYTERYLGCVDSVCAGRRGAISEDRRLLSDYDPSFYGVLRTHLSSSPDVRVRAETVLLLARLGERRAADDVRKLRLLGKDLVDSACLAYFDSIGEDDRYVPELIDTLRHRRGQEFRIAAMRVGAAGRAEDVPALREICGQVDGAMREQMKAALGRIVDRCPELAPERELILSDPVYPDEKAFARFADSACVYLDIRYRDNVLERQEIPAATYANVSRALKKIGTRLYNERANLRWYSDEAKRAHAEAEELLAWAAEDLETKAVLSRPAARIAHDCPSCGSRMALSNGVWTCPDCGFHGRRWRIFINRVDVHNGRHSISSWFFVKVDKGKIGNTHREE